MKRRDFSLAATSLGLLPLISPARAPKRCRSAGLSMPADVLILAVTCARTRVCRPLLHSLAQSSLSDKPESRHHHTGGRPDC